MKKIFTFKHYWDKSDASAKLMPEWLSYSDSKLSYEQKKIKKLARKLTSPSLYAQLSKHDSGVQNIMGYHVYYQCKKEEDFDPTNNRKVTNITFCISKKPIDENKCSWKVSDLYIPLEKKSHTKYVIASVVIFAGALLYVWLDNTKSNIVNNEIISDKHDYSILVSKWNEATIKNNLSNKYILPSDNNNTLKKLNSILSVYAENKEYLKLCNRSKKGKIYIPVEDYCAFIRSKKSEKKIQLVDSMDEAKIISIIKSVTGHPYIDNRMILDIVFLDSFEIYFNHNIEKFHANGFSKNITTYVEYVDMLDQVNE